jgi:hypothetical protein
MSKPGLGTNDNAYIGFIKLPVHFLFNPIQLIVPEAGGSKVKVPHLVKPFLLMGSLESQGGSGHHKARGTHTRDKVKLAFITDSLLR